MVLDYESYLNGSLNGVQFWTEDIRNVKELTFWGEKFTLA